MEQYYLNFSMIAVDMTKPISGQFPDDLTTPDGAPITNR